MKIKGLRLLKCLQFVRVSVLFKGMHKTFLMYKIIFDNSEGNQ
ncbi:hypothetical protein D920_01978 [Enterococcus faecalis 13-SD-W-01]|nr:hypothetical protein D920_01978 [Enterococcus faecalis 13-SD-W-01]